MYRAIVEMSNMSNNDEYYLHGKSVAELQDRFAELKKRASHFDQPRIICMREVSREEIEAGLDTRSPISAWKNDAALKRPEMTVVLDEVGKLIQGLHGMIVELKMTPQRAVIDAIAYSYYDCMSGGSSWAFLSACRYLIKNWNVPLDSEVYPSGNNKWHTIADFLEDIKDVPEFGTEYLEPVKQMLSLKMSERAQENISNIKELDHE